MTKAATQSKAAPGRENGSAATTFGFDLIAVAREQWEERYSDRESSSGLAALTSLMRAQQLTLAELNRLLRPFGLTFARYEALMLLSFSRNGSLSLGRIGEKLQVHQTSITNLIDKLEEDELVERIPHKSDRRAIMASLTPKGRKLGERATAVMREANFAMNGLTLPERDQLTELIRKVRIAAGDFEEAAD